jgi:hypothetical protein
VLTLQKSGADSQDATLKRGLDWLRQHQEKDGRWQAPSLNAQRDPKTDDAALFMSDAATAYAVLALENPSSQLQSGNGQ